MSAALADAAARSDALDLSINALVMAPAGSGKTGLLVQRMLRALATVDEPEQVVAITFTRKAAAEIRARVLDALSQAASGEAAESDNARLTLEAARAVLSRDQQRGWNLRAHPARLGATTIDSFCAQLAAQSPLLSGLGGSMAISDDPTPLYEQAILRLFEEINDRAVPQQDRDALARVLRLSANRFDRLMGPLAQLLSQRDRWLRAAAGSDAEVWAEQDRAVIGALWDTASGEFEAALGEAGKQTVVECLAAASASPGGPEWASGLAAWPTDSTDQLRRIAQALLTGEGKLRKQVDKRNGFPPGGPVTQRFRAWLKACEGDHRLEAAAQHLAGLPDPELPAALVDLRLAWLRVLKRLAAHLRLVFAEVQQTDFAELAQAALAALRPSAEEFGEALLRSDQHIRHLLVDEMQDTSDVQLMLIEQLTAGWTSDDDRSLFLVGDPQQSIYGFRNAEVRLFLGLWESLRLGTLELVPLRLSANFRSDPAVVEWFNQSFRQIFPQEVDIVRGAVPFAASEPTGPRSGEAGVSVHAFLDESAEADHIAAQAASLATQDTTVAVLARTRNRLEPVIRALRARGVTPSCQDLDPLASLPEVRDVLALAQALWHPQDRLSWAVLLRAPFVGLSWNQMLSLSIGRQKMDWPQRIRRALDETDRLDPDARERLSKLMAAIDASERDARLRANLADQCEAVWRALGGPMACSRPALDDVRQALLCLREETRGGSIRDLAQLQRRIRQLYAAVRPGQVQLMTVHKAKGLEFDHVFLAGASGKARGHDAPALHLMSFPEGTLLIPRPDEAWPESDPSRIAYEFLGRTAREASDSELLRLLYVAITRARRSCQICLTVERGEKNGAVQYPAGSFARALSPVIHEVVESSLGEQVERVPVTEQDRRPPIAPRLPLGCRLPVEEGLYRPTESRALRPSESVLLSQEDPDAKRDEGDLYAQLIGTLYHEAMQRISEEGMGSWTDAGQSRATAMAAGLRRRGMPEPLVEPAVRRVVQLLGTTLAGDHGSWLLGPRPWARSEYALGGLLEGRWVSAVIDRCFEDEEGRLWVVDYKTSAGSVPSDQVEPYLQQGRLKYREQVLRYAELMGELHPGRPVLAALYFADPDRLEIVS